MLKKFTSLLFLSFCLLGITNSSIAQTPQHFIQNLSGANSFPLNSSTSNKCQFLILASELSGVLMPGAIGKIYITPAGSSSAATYTDFTVKIGMTNSTDLGSGSQAFITGLSTALYAPSYTITGVVADQWIEIPLDNPVFYDGTSNLIIEISQSAYVASFSLRINTSIAGRRLYGSLANLDGTAGGGRLDFGMDLSPLGPNNAGLTSLTSPVSFCPGTYDVKVMVRNSGDNVIDSVKVAWSLDGIAQTTYSLTDPLDTMNGTGFNEREVTLGSHTFTNAPVAFKAWTFLPNNVPDTVNQNDTLTQTLQSSLSGIYTINSAQTTGGANFQSFADFTTALNNFGICGPVIANVSGGPFIETVSFGSIDGTSATNTIRINGNGATVQYNNTVSERQLLTLTGTKYLTIDNLTFKSLAIDYGWGALITGGAANDSIINCFFDLTSITSTGSANSNGIAFSGSNTAATSAGSNGSHLYVGNNHFKWSDGTGGGYYALGMAGECDSNVIDNNIFENFYYYGSYMNGGTGNQLLNNEFHKENKTASLTTFYGIYTTGVTPGIEIRNNRIHHPGGVSGATGSFYGIYALGDGTAADPGIIANNAIYEVNQNATLYGINLNTAPYVSVYHNTIVFDKPLASTAVTYGIYTTGTNTNSDIKNNNIVITAGTSGTKYGFYYSSLPSINDAQKNNIYVNSTQSGTQNYGYYAAAYSTQAAFQSAHPLLEIGSPSTDPMFVNALIGNFNVQSPLLIGAGENLLAFVPKDINGNPRSAASTIGAFEEPPTGNNNAGVVAFITPEGTFCSGPQSVSVSIKNGGVNNINNLKLNWTVNGVAQPQVSYTGTLVPITSSTGQNSDTVVLGNATISGGGPTEIIVWTSLPNGAQDTVNNNDTMTQSFQASLSGTYTINSAVITGGANYQSFVDFIDDLNAYGVCGPVVANVSGGPFVEAVSFGNIEGASAINTIRINGNGATVQYANTTTERQLLTLTGTQYVTIDSLTFKTLDTDYGWAALITGGAAYDSIINCYFDLTSVTSISSVNTNGITFSGSSTSPTTSGSNGSHIYIGNNHLKWSDSVGGGYYALTVMGANDSNVIENNIFENYYYYGAYINGPSDLKLLNNIFHRENKTASLTTFYGIYTNGVTPGMELNGNRIHHPGGAIGGSGTFYGIYSLGDGTLTSPVVIANNAIYDVNQNGLLYGIYLSTSPYNYVYHNTVVFDKPVVSASTTYGIYSTGTNTNTEIKNNNVVITGGTTGAKYGFYYPSAVSISDVQKNNIYVNSTQAGAQNYGYYTTIYADQLAFQTAYPLLEIGSPTVDPLFVNATLGNFNVQNALLIGAGENVQAIVPTDINGNARPLTPTIGAFEQPPAGSNNAGMLFFETPTGSYCAGQQSVSAIINNGGVNNITSVKVNWTVNGIAQPVFNYTGVLVPLTSTGNNTATVVLGNATIASGAPTVIKAWTSLPNGVADVFNVNDTIELNFQASHFFAEALTDSICVGDDAILYLTPNSGYSVGDLQWQTSTNGTSWTNIPNTDDVSYSESNLLANKYFRVKVGSGSNICYSDSVRVVVVPVAIPTVISGERCGPGTVSLSATSAASNTLKWYDVITGGTPIATTPTFTTPFLNVTTDYWVSSAFGGGASDSLAIPLATGNTSGVYHHMFMVHSIAGMDINSIGIKCMNTVGTLTDWDIYYRPDNYQLVPGANTSATGWILLSSVTNVPSLGTNAYTEIALGLSLNIPANTTYSLYIAPVGAATHQYSSPVIGTVTASNAYGELIAGNRGSSLFSCTSSGGQATVKLSFSTGCESPRQMVTATIKPQPIVDLGNDTAICSNANLTLDAGNPGSTYLWNNNSTSQTLNITSAGNYSVKVTNNGCSSSDTVVVGVTPTPLLK